MILLDAHCHLELYENIKNKMSKEIPNDLAVITMTNTPQTFHWNMELFRGQKAFFVGAGLHPQLILERKNELFMLLKIIDNHRFVGEIGIDGVALNIDEQIYVFSELVTHIDNLGNRIVSIHSKKAAGLVISLLHDLVVNKTNVYILHWFTGTKKELEKAIELGCYFSINKKMCASKKGIEIIKSIPADRILVETDSPFTKKVNSFLDLRNELLLTIQEIEKVREEKLLEIISKASERILFNYS